MSRNTMTSRSGRLGAQDERMTGPTKVEVNSGTNGTCPYRAHRTARKIKWCPAAGQGRHRRNFYSTQRRPAHHDQERRERSYTGMPSKHPRRSCGAVDEEGSAQTET